MCEFNKKYYLLPLLGGILLALSLNYPVFWFLSFFSFVPLFYFIGLKNTDSKKVFWGSFLFGFVFMGWTLSWSFNTLPLDWAGIETPSVGFILVFSAWLLEAIVFGLLTGIFGIAVHKIYERNIGWMMIAGTPSIWVLIEYVKSIVMTFVWSGPGTLLGPHWSMGTLGYLLAENETMLQLASLGGVYLLSFIIIFINVLVYGISISPKKLIKKKLAHLACVALFTIMLSIIVGKISAPEHDDETFLNVAVAQTNFASAFSRSDNEHVGKFSEITRLMFTAKNDIEKDGRKVDILILPEDSRFFSHIEKDSQGEIVKDILGNENAIVIDSGAKTNDGRLKSKLEYISTNGEITDSEKIFLMPFGEFLPRAILFPAKIFGMDEWVDNFNGARKYFRGNNPTIAEFNGVKLGTLFCSEIISTDLYREITRDGAGLLINISSQSIFNKSSIFFKQILNIAQVRSVENRRFFVQSSNYAPSFILNDRGQVVKISDTEKNSVIYGKIAPRTIKTPYTKAGNWILLLSGFMVLVLFFTFLHKRNS